MMFSISSSIFYGLNQEEESNIHKLIPLSVIIICVITTCSSGDDPKNGAKITTMLL